MMSPETISYLARKQARTAAKNGSKPLIIEAEDMPRIDKVIRHIPNIGTYRPRNYKLVEHFLVDKSGFGAEDEPALTFAGLCRRVKQGMAYAIIEEGQFQVVIGEFEVKRAVHIDPALRVPLPPLPPIPDEPVVRYMRQSDMLRCPHVIMLPSHYREDGSCKCDDPAERAMMIKEWGYKKKDFAKLPLRAEV